MLQQQLLQAASQDRCPSVPKTQSCPPPTRCRGVKASPTDPAMKWRCQAPGAAVSPVYRTYRECTDEHLICTPDSTVQPELVVFLPGTGLVPRDYSDIVADFAGHGFHSLGLMYPSTQGQNGCEMSRQPNNKSTNLNCTARERYRVLTGEAASFGGTDTHTNITKPDSIVNRLSKALIALGPPWTGWLDADGYPVFGKIIIAGHSNGADHAGFFAKTFAVARALMFAGANDMVGGKPKGVYTTPAPWQFYPGATAPEKLYGFGVCGTVCTCIRATLADFSRVQQIQPHCSNLWRFASQ